MSRVFFIRIKGKILGPFSVPQLKDLSARGRFSSFHEVSQDGRTWAEASSLSDVFPQEKDDDVDFVDDTASNAGGAAAFFFIDASGATRGPVSETDLVTLLRCGQVHANTLVWRQGMAQWQPLQSAVTLSGITLPPPVPNSSDPGAMDSHSIFPSSNTIPCEFHYRHPALSILLHYVTFGLFTFFWLNSLHGRLPKNRSDDPSEGKAIWFHLIPIYQVYWMFFVNYRLCVRINEQRKSHGFSDGIPPWLSILHSLLTPTGISFFVPIFFVVVQTNVNDLARRE